MQSRVQGGLTVESQAKIREAENGYVFRVCLFSKYSMKVEHLKYYQIYGEVASADESRRPMVLIPAGIY